MPLEEGTSAFITMNPGYIGRAELPESLKALFRPITVMVPDRQLIMENMLMAEGFVEAKLLAKKFASLYYLLEDLLSPQKHYDWGLRAIKSVLVVAGSLLRAEAGQVESDVLFRALRDFNVPKILAQDMVIFSGLLNDLFPGALTDSPAGPSCCCGLLALLLNPVSAHVHMWFHVMLRRYSVLLLAHQYTYAPACRCGPASQA